MFFVVDEDVCTRCALCVDRCPTGVIILGKVTDRLGRGRPQRPHQPARLRLRRPLLGDDRGQRERRTATATETAASASSCANAVAEVGDKLQGSQAWNSIFRPGSIFRKGYTDSPRNRSYVIMNNVLYHLHPVKVKRHAVKVSYTLCLGGLSFFLFILLTVTGIFLMFFYRPTVGRRVRERAEPRDRGRRSARSCETCIDGPRTSWCSSVFLHMSRVFYHGAYKAPREFNWVIGVILLTLTLLLSFTGYLLPWDQLALWAVTVGTNMMGYTPVFGGQVQVSCCSVRRRSAATRCCAGTCCTC